ncbi:S8 family serine peptidase [Streptomyces himalayensis]|uniref:S8 family serine peptidase n=1 Tax=Streptomyces himalayensis subsp. himalayensis TaxID=2756131 RepID=A0A7W0I7D5_9ACTN|nr:S8 family serine peptidase [Streptomyces himalayensis]MBA2944901.1 S8 family serine peptidase [Streptomyces himalayensis subsp. himalayensis]
MAFKRTVRALSAAALTGALILAAAPAASADQTRRDQWALEALQAESVWKVSTGKGVTVAVIENSGVNLEHVDLKNNLLKGRDFEDGDDDPSPEAGGLQPDHGTAMAADIAAHGHGPGGVDGVKGLAPDAKILPIRSGGTGYADEIRYAVEQGASVINISETQTLDLAEDREAVAYALKRDVLIVSGSGNGGNDDIRFPAKYPGVLTVGGVDRSGEVWENSNYGPEVLLIAPATRIVSAGWPGSKKLHIADGTSDSTAFVSAAAALLRSKFPDLTAGQIVNRLVKTAELPESAKGISLPDEKYGYGAIRPLAALTEDIPAGPKYGPLKVPESLNPSDSGKSDADYAAENEKADQKQMIFLGVLALVALAVIGLIVFLIVKLSRRNKNNNGGPDGPVGYPQYGQQPNAPQQNPYQQQPFPPQQNPYQQQPTPPQGQWPPQQ